MPGPEWASGTKPAPWLKDAACAKEGAPPAEFFESSLRLKRQTVMKFCNSSCPVREACLEDAMATEARHQSASRSGVRGGHSASGRMRLAAERRRAAAAVDGGTA